MQSTPLSLNRSISALVCITLILVLHAITNYFVLHGKVFTDPDIQAYYANTHHIVDAVVRSARPMHDMYRAAIDFWKPPFFYFAASPFVYMLRSLNGAIMVNLLFLFITLLAVYKAGSLLYGSGVGLFAAFLTSMFPSVFALSRVFYMETALTALVQVTFLLFVLNRFESKRFVVVTGFIIGIGLLTKQAYGIYLMPFILYFFLQKNNMKRSFSLLAAILIALILAHPWYLFNENRISMGTVREVFLGSANNVTPLYYLDALFTRQLLPVYSVLFVIAFIASIRRKEFYLPFMVFVLIVFFSFSTNKQDRFILPLFPFIALMISATVWSLKDASKRMIAIGCIILFSIVQFLSLSFAFPLKIYNEKRFYAFIRWPYYTLNGGIFGITAQEFDPEKALSQAPALFEETASEPVGIVMVTDFTVQSLLMYHLTAAKIPYVAHLNECDQGMGRYSDTELTALSQENMNRSEYFVTDNSSYEGRQRHSGILRGLFKQQAGTYKKKAEIDLSAERVVTIYKKIR